MTTTEGKREAYSLASRWIETQLRRGTLESYLDLNNLSEEDRGLVRDGMDELFQELRRRGGKQ